MKKLNIIILGFLLIGCSKEKTLIKEAEKYLIKHLNVPEFYERELGKIIDTLTVHQLEIKKCNDSLIKIKKNNPNLESMIDYTKMLIKELPNSSKHFDRQIGYYYATKLNGKAYYFNEDGMKNLLREEKNLLDSLVNVTDKYKITLELLDKKNDSLIKATDQKEVVSIDLYLRYKTKNIYGGAIREISTIRCTPEKKNQKIIWSFKSINTETITNN